MTFKFDQYILHLSKSYSSPWKYIDNIFVRGYGFIEDKLYKDYELIEYFSSIQSRDEIVKRAHKLNGFFSLIIILEDELIAVVDHVRSFPLFYNTDKNGVLHVYDALGDAVIGKAKINENVKKQFLNSLFVLGSDTLLMSYYQVEAGHYLYGTSSSVRQIMYWKFGYSEQPIIDFNYALEAIDLEFRMTFKRLIKLLDGRTAVIPLSGGHDSRLIAFYLHKLNYKNVITYSYGSKGNNEGLYGKRIAEELSFPYYYIEYSYKKVKEVHNNIFNKYCIYAGNASSVPCMQELYAVNQLVSNNIITNKCVIIPGFSGDFVAGSHIPSELFELNSVKKETLINSIIKKHFNERKIWDFQGSFIETLKANISSINYYNIKDQMPSAKAIEIYEHFDLNERQAKFIQNAVRVYEFFNIPWVTPYFEKSQFEIWSKIPNKYRYKRKIFFKIEERIYPKNIKEVGYAHESKKMNFLYRWVSYIVNLLFCRSTHHFLFSHISFLKYYRNLIKKGYRSVNVHFQAEYIKLLIRNSKRG